MDIDENKVVHMSSTANAAAELLFKEIEQQEGPEYLALMKMFGRLEELTGLISMTASGTPQEGTLKKHTIGTFVIVMALLHELTEHKLGRTIDVEDVQKKARMVSDTAARITAKELGIPLELMVGQGKRHLDS